MTEFSEVHLLSLMDKMFPKSAEIVEDEEELSWLNFKPDGLRSGDTTQSSPTYLSLGRV